MRLLDAAPLFSKRADIGSDIAGFISAQREIGHFRMRIEQKERELLGAEIRFVCYRRERWNICTRPFLCAVNDVTRSAPALCEVCTVICIGCHRRRQDQTKHASNNKQMLTRGHPRGADPADAHRNRWVSPSSHSITSLGARPSPAGFVVFKRAGNGSSTAQEGKS